jgi:hypothetical protein
MHDGILVAVRNACQMLIPFPDRSKSFVYACASQRDIPFLPELLCAPHALAINAESLAVFLFIEHRHFSAAPPAPERLHPIPF